MKEISLNGFLCGVKPFLVYIEVNRSYGVIMFELVKVKSAEKE